MLAEILCRISCLALRRSAIMLLSTQHKTLLLWMKIRLPRDMREGAAYKVQQTARVSEMMMYYLDLYMYVITCRCINAGIAESQAIT